MKIQFHRNMAPQEIQDFIHVYSVFSFKDGHKEPGICINRYNVATAKVEYYFIPQVNMPAYKNAFDRFDKESCKNLCILMNPEEVLSIRPVSLADYKLIMELLEERKKLVHSKF